MTQRKESIFNYRKNQRRTNDVAVDCNDISKATYKVGTTLEWECNGKNTRGKIIRVGRDTHNLAYRFIYRIAVEGLDETTKMFETVLPDEFSSIDDTKTRTAKSNVLEGDYLYIVGREGEGDKRKPFITEGRVAKLDYGCVHVDPDHADIVFYLEDGRQFNTFVTSGLFKDKKDAEEYLHYNIAMEAGEPAEYNFKWGSNLPLHDIQVVDLGLSFEDEFTIDTVDGDFKGRISHYAFDKSPFADIVPATIPMFHITLKGETEHYSGLLSVSKPLVKVIGKTKMQNMSLF